MLGLSACLALWLGTVSSKSTRAPVLTEDMLIRFLVAALPFDADVTALISQDHGLADALDKRSFNDGLQLRVLPLGASIVYGLHSSDGNGFRYGLREQLVYNGNPTHMIGSVQSGTMVDNNVEGWPGYTITQVAAKAELDIADQPNLVILHVGTNDCVQSLDIDNAGARLGTLIDYLFDNIPGVTIVASTLLPNGNPTTQANVDIYNSQIPALIQARQAAGKKITYVDFSSSWWSVSDLGSDGFVDTSADTRISTNLYNRTHPTDAGYLKMAEVWWRKFSRRSKRDVLGFRTTSQKHVDS